MSVTCQYVNCSNTVSTSGVVSSIGIFPETQIVERLEQFEEKQIEMVLTPVEENAVFVDNDQ
jgi:hypothetical protein